ARATRRALEHMLDLTELTGWRPPIVDTVATTGEGVDELWATIGRHRDHQLADGTLDELRRRRVEREFRQILVSRLFERIDEQTASAGFAPVFDAMLAGEVDPYEAADRLLAATATGPRADE